EIFSVAGMPEACVLQRLLLDWIRHHTGNLPRKSELRRTLDRGDGRARIGRIRLSRTNRCTEMNREHRQGAGKSPNSLHRAVDWLQWDREAEVVGQFLESRDIVDGEKRSRLASPLLPRLEGEFAADAGRLAHRDGERRRHAHIFCL